MFTVYIIHVCIETILGLIKVYIYSTTKSIYEIFFYLSIKRFFNILMKRYEFDSYFHINHSRIQYFNC